MGEELISKKEILDMTGISYGQLYRWKRKNLIPEEWFIKKSSYTGQETFFPKDKIVERINKIIELKEDIPLDDLADMFSNKINVGDISEDYLIQCGLINEDVLKVYKEMFGKKSEYTLKDVLLIYVLKLQLDLGSISITEIEMMINLIDREYSKLESLDGTVYFIRRLGVGICLLAFKERIIVDDNSKVISEINIRTTIENIKFKLTIFS